MVKGILSAEKDGIPSIMSNNCIHRFSEWEDIFPTHKNKIRSSRLVLVLEFVRN